MRPFFLILLVTSQLIAADFPAPFNSGNEKDRTPTPVAEALAAIKLPPGFRAQCFASEPMVQNPIACAWDARGRLWIAENYTYADQRTNFDKTLRDRILILEDTDGNGTADKRTVFADDLQNLTSIALGHGGVFATAAPHLLFIPDRDGDDIPDAAKIPTTETSEKVPSSANPAVVQKTATHTEILLDGFDAWSVRHNFVNGLKWGPDGWLYGRHGIQATSHVGAPGTPAAERVTMNCGIWRFHPVRHTFEVVCWGGTNPWGLDWNAEGEGFFVNSVIGHAYHLIPGAHYERMYGEDPNPHIYQLLPQTADHHHFDTGKGWTASRDGKANDLGGGHAHSGCMIYQGDNWPAEYRGKLFTANLHGHRINTERIEPSGSGYVIKHDTDFAFFGDPWFRGTELTTGPDGSVYILDWCDIGECHENDGVHRTSGRIWKITYGEGKKPTSAKKNRDLAKLTTTELIKVVESADEWSARIARRITQERSLEAATANELERAMVKAFTEEAAGNVTEKTKQRRWELWNSVGSNTGFIGRFGEAFFMCAYQWQRETEKWPEEDMRRRLRSLWSMNTDRVTNFGYTSNLRHRKLSLTHRLYLASFAQRVKGLRGKHIWQDLIGADDFGSDLPLVTVTWGAIEQTALDPQMPGDFYSNVIHKVIDNSKSPILYRWAARLVFSDLEKNSERATKLLEYSQSVLPSELPSALRNGDRAVSVFVDDPAKLPSIIARSKEFLSGMTEGLRGRQKAPKPAAWDAFARRANECAELAPLVRELNVIFGDGRALDEIRAVALDKTADIAARRQAVQTLVQRKPADLRATLEKLVGDSDLLAATLQGLATFDDPAAGALIVSNFKRVRADARPGVIAALCSRPTFAGQLLDAIAAEKITTGELTPYHARQIAALGDPALTAKLGTVWGTIATPADLPKRIAEWRAKLPAADLAKADLAKGRALFSQTCGACHKLNGEGGDLAPDLTGSGRSDLGYLLENILAPNAVVPAGYRLNLIELKDGRVLSGFIPGQNDTTLTLRTMTETHTIERASITKTTLSEQSLMPEGLLNALTQEQVRDLLGYLMKK